jgi:lysophospholipase L1-like esterase
MPKSKKQRSSETETNSPPLTPRRRALYLSIPYLIVALLLLFVEVGTRLVLPHVSTLESLVEAQHTQSNFIDRERVTIFEGDPLLFWRLKPNLSNVVWDFTVVSTNAEGLRHDGDIKRKEPGTLRVVCLGDSVTFGYRVPVVWAERPNDYNRDWLPYPQLLEKALRAANPDRKIEVIALAVPGYTSYQGLAWLRRDIERLEPDVVTACFGWNDIGLRSVTDRELMPDDFWHVAYRTVVSHSQALSHFTLWMQRRRAAKEIRKPAVTPRVPRDEFAANMIEIARLAEEHNARAILIGTVYRDAVTNPGEAAQVKAHRDALRIAANSHGIPYLEIPELMEAANSQNLFGELIHPNHEGHRLMALSLLKFFAAYNTLKGLNVPQSL